MISIPEKLRLSSCLLSLLLTVFTMAASAAYAEETSSLSFVSQSGDWVGAGQSLSFSDISSNISSDKRIASFSVSTPNHWWYLTLAAPVGQQLVPGVYEGAARWPFQAANQPGLSLYGDGRGCNQLAGRFEVLQATYGSMGKIEKFHARFEQRCEIFMPPLYGEIKVNVGTSTDESLVVVITVDPEGGAPMHGNYARITGSISCSRTATARIIGVVTQNGVRDRLRTGRQLGASTCSERPTPWSLQVSADELPFRAGPAQVDVQTSATAGGSDIQASDEERTVVRLRAVKN